MDLIQQAKDNITAEIIADSVNPNVKEARLTTFKLKFPRWILAQMNTHRVFSRNSSSSRAVPIQKMIDQVKNNPALPIHWGKNQKGMQAFEVLTGIELHQAQQAWLTGAEKAVEQAQMLYDCGLHKQIVNRVLEPFQYVEVVLSGTEFENFFELRIHEDAQPEIFELASKMKHALENSKPRETHCHLPFITDDELELYKNHKDLLMCVSAARCCRVSYLLLDGTQSNVRKDLELCIKLAGSTPIHASPFEHQAWADTKSEITYHSKFGPISGEDWDFKWFHGNFVGWCQHRKEIEGIAHSETKLNAYFATLMDAVNEIESV